MPKIYVNTDNSNSKAKIYEAGKGGKGNMLLDAGGDATRKIMKKCFPLMRVNMTKR